jgi:multidrug efflux pump subunit AcrA (membrane-fusion protein)
MEVMVSRKVSGRVVALRVRESDRVRAGDLLAIPSADEGRGMI